MSKNILVFICVLFPILFLGCKDDISKDTISKLMDYDDKYVGDASAVGNILRLLGNTYSSIQLTTPVNRMEFKFFVLNKNQMKK